MAPQYQFLTSSSDPVVNEKTIQNLLAEVLRCHTYFDETVFHNTMKVMSQIKLTGARTDGIRLSMVRYVAVVFHSISDKNRRKTLFELGQSIGKCKIPVLKNEQELFLNSMHESDDVPSFTKCMHKNDLALCYFRRELDRSHWKNIQNLLNQYPGSLMLFDHIDAFLSVAENQKISAEELMDVFMNYCKVNNPYFMEEEDFKTTMKKVLKACSSVAKESINVMRQLKKTHISFEESELLKKAIDEYVHSSKEAYVKTKEYEKVVSWVREWKRIQKFKDWNNIVVVDALNFGTGCDPVEWKSISSQFKHVLFASRFPPLKVRDRVMKRYGGNALFCDKLSADDLIILRMALEFGPRTSLVTNDQYRDHRKFVCKGDSVLGKIWDDFLIDAVYRHHDRSIESRRSFNLRVQKVNGQWLIPVMDSEGNSQKMRNLKVYTVGKNDQNEHECSGKEE